MRLPLTGKFINVNEGVASSSATPDEAHARLMPVAPRAMYRGEIYEIFVTDDAGAAPGGTMKRFSLVGHFEVENACFVRTGDVVSVGGKELGTIVGYNQCKALRAPELAVIHLYVRAKKLVTGRDMGLKLGDKVQTKPVERQAPPSR